MNKENLKHKTKKPNPPTNADYETFLRNQQNIFTRLKTDLQSAISEAQLSENETMEKHKLIVELEQSINQREAEIYKLNNNLEQLKEENSQILMEFNFFKEKFYQLETDYDKNLNLQYEQNESWRKQFEQQQTSENQEIQQLSVKCHELQQRLQDNINGFAHLNKLHVETLQNFDQLKLNYEQQQNEFELYKRQVAEEKKLNEVKYNHDLAALTDEIKQKEEILKECIANKNALEKEKNLIIDELKNKICRIERAFSQPTKIVQPMATSPQEINNSDYSETSNENVAVTLPQVHKPLENPATHTLSNNENLKVEQNQNQRNYKFKRPFQPPTSSQQSNPLANSGAQGKRKVLPKRSSANKNNYNEFSTSSSDEDGVNDTNYSNFSQKLWRPSSKDCYVPDTDTSEGFNINKRSKK